MLVTNEGQIIRIRVHGGEGDSIRVAGRKTQGVRLFDVSGGEDEKVVSAGLIRDADDEDGDGDEGDGDATGVAATEGVAEGAAGDAADSAGDEEASE